MVACAIAIVLAAAWLGRTTPIARRVHATRSAAAMAVIALAVVVAVNGKSVETWLRYNAVGLPLDVGWAKTGVILRETTPADAKVAMFGAGNTGYFDHRYGIDMLGKMDPVIARTKPHASRFLPGHDKWDFNYSVGRLRPDVITQGLRLEARPADLCALRRWGYRAIAPQLLVRNDIGPGQAELGRRVTALHFYPPVPFPSSCP